MVPEGSIRHVRVTRRRSAIELGLVLVAWALPALLVAGIPGWSGLALLLFAAAAVVGWVWWTVKPRRLSLRGSIQIRDGCLYLDEVALARREDVRAGYVRSASHGASLVLADHRGFERVAVDFEEPREAEAVLSALRFGVDQAVVDYALSGRTPRTTSWTIGLGLGFPAVVLGSYGASAFAQNALGVAPFLATALMVTVIAAASGTAWWWWRRSRVQLSIGPDGISIADRLERRFVGYDAIASLRWWPGLDSGEGDDLSEGFDLVLRDGERLPLRTIDVRMREGGPGQCPIHDRIRAGMALGGSRRVGAERPLFRGPGDSVRAWLGALRSTGIGAGDTLRTPPTTSEELWSLVEDPRAEPLSRAAAAVALTADGDAGARIRVEEIAESVASPDLRALLDSCAADDGDVEESMELLVSRAVLPPLRS